MKHKLIFTLGLILLSFSSYSQRRFFGGLEGNYYQGTLSYKLDSLEYTKDDFITKNYSFGLNAGIFISPNFAVGIGFRKGGLEDYIKLSYSQAYRELISSRNAIKAFGRHQILKGKFGFVSDVQLVYSFSKDVQIEGGGPKIQHLKEKTYSLAYVPRFIYYPMPNLSLDLALFQVRYFHQTRTEENLSKQIYADFEMDFTTGPTLGIHYYFNAGSSE